jgi:hypothetical protein
MFTGPIQLAAQEVFKTSTTKLHNLGAQGVTADGRVFRYALAGGVALAPGKLNQNPAVVANHQNVLVAVAPNVGDNALSVTLGATAMTAGQYDDGYVVGYDVAGFGQSLRIQGSPAINSSATGQLLLADPVVQALTTSSRVNLEQNPWSNSLVYATGATTQMGVGVALVSVPAGSYGWFQTRGTAAVLGNGTVAAGSGLVPGQTTAGSLDIEAAATVTQRVGIQQQAGASTKYNTVYLTID